MKTPAEMIRDAEQQLDDLLHPLDMTRLDIDLEIGMARGAAHVVAVIRGTTFATEARRSFERLDAKVDAQKGGKR